jgi:hypothetical protein
MPTRRDSLKRAGVATVGLTPLVAAASRALTKKVLEREHDQVLRMWMPLRHRLPGLAVISEKHRLAGPPSQRWLGASTFARLWIDK